MENFPGSWWFVVPVLAAGAMLSVWRRKLSPAAGLLAIVIGACLYAGCGYPGLLLLAAFFLMATLATAHRKAEKAKAEAVATHTENRGAGQVLANGGIAALAALSAALFPGIAETMSLLCAAAIASATADTLSSELGMVYGRRFFNILTFKEEVPGPDGVVSVEGTLLGGAGALIIALLYAAAWGNAAPVWIIVLSGMAGNLADSLMGALWERKQLMGNNMVNLLNTLIASLVAGLLLLF